MRSGEGPTNHATVRQPHMRRRTERLRVMSRDSSQDVVSVPHGSRFKFTDVRVGRNLHHTPVVRLDRPRDRVTDDVPRRPIVVLAGAGVGTDDGPFAVAEHVLVYAVNEVEVTTSDRWETGLTRALAVGRD